MKNDEYMKDGLEPSLFDAEDTEEISKSVQEIDGEDVLDIAEEESAELTPSTTSFVPDVYAETDSVDEENVYTESEASDHEEKSTDKDSSSENESADEDTTDAQATSSNAAISVQQDRKPTVKPEEKVRKVDSLFDFIELFVFTLAAVFMITSFFFRYSTVKGGSMLNTLESEEKLILSSFLYNPKPGDIVVVQDRSTQLKDPIVKRVIAIGGQTVKFTRDTVYVDGKALVEDYVYTGDYFDQYTGSRDYKYEVEPCPALIEHVIGYQEGVYYEILVPEGEIFVMGDHRNNSMDSRNIGTLHEDAVIGKAVLRFYPFEKFGKIED